MHDGCKMVIPTTPGLTPGTYDPARTQWEATIDTVNDKGQIIMVDGTLVETQRPSWQAAARRGEIELMMQYIEEKQVLGHGVDFREPTGYTPLAIAVQHNQLTLARLLIEKGADVNTQNNWRDSPLHRACEQGFVEMVQLLMDHGANPLLEDNVRRRPPMSPKPHPSLAAHTKREGARTACEPVANRRDPCPIPSDPPPDPNPDANPDHCFEDEMHTHSPSPACVLSAAKPEGV